MTNDESENRRITFERFSERWPMAGDRLLASGRDTFLAEHADERNYRLLQGYKRAGDILMENALNEPYDRNSVNFPCALQLPPLYRTGPQGSDRGPRRVRVRLPGLQKS